MRFLVVLMVLTACEGVDGEQTTDGDNGQIGDDARPGTPGGVPYHWVDAEGTVAFPTPERARFTENGAMWPYDARREKFGYGGIDLAISYPSDSCSGHGMIAVFSHLAPKFVNGRFQMLPIDGEVFIAHTVYALNGNGDCYEMQRFDSYAMVDDLIDAGEPPAVDFVPPLHAVEGPP